MIICYVAARWETKDDADKLRDALAERGIGCTSRWLEEEPSLGDVPEEKKILVAGMDALDVRRAQALVLWNPPEKHRQGTGGCHVEVGMALALGIPVLVVGGGSNVFHWLPGVTRIRFSGSWPDSDDLRALVAAIKSACPDYGPAWDSPEDQEARREAERFKVRMAGCKNEKHAERRGLIVGVCSSCGATLFGGVDQSTCRHELSFRDEAGVVTCNQCGLVKA